VIEALATHPNLTGVTELSKHLGLTKSNAHRLLQTLVACGYVRNLEQSGKYELTLKLWELGAAVVDRLDLKTVAVEYMERLCQLSGETVHLSVLEGTEVIYLDKVDSPHPVRRPEARNCALRRSRRKGPPWHRPEDRRGLRRFRKAKVRPAQARPGQRRFSWGPVGKGIRKKNCRECCKLTVFRPSRRRNDP